MAGCVHFAPCATARKARRSGVGQWRRTPTACLLQGNLPHCGCGCPLRWGQHTTAQTTAGRLPGSAEERFEFWSISMPSAAECPACPWPSMRSASRSASMLAQRMAAPHGPRRPRDPLLGAAARAHPAQPRSWPCCACSWGDRPHGAWARVRGWQPLLSFSEGAPSATAVRLRRRPAEAEERQLGL